MKVRTKQAIIALLRRLQEHEEGIIESSTYDGPVSPPDAQVERAVRQSRSIVRKCKSMIASLRRPERTIA